MLNAVEPAAFEAWVADVRAGGGTLDAAGYAVLAASSTGAAAAAALNRSLPLGFGTVDPGLYERILHRCMAAAAWRRSISRARPVSSSVKCNTVDG